MLEWLTGRTKRGELPEYSRLREVPSRPLPAEILRAESGDAFASRRSSIEARLRQDHTDPDGDLPRFFSFIATRGQGVVTIPMPDGQGQCLPVFSSPLRAADYRQTLLTGGPPVQYLASTPTELSRMLRDIAPAGIESITVDRCPRCAVFSAAGTQSLKTGRDLVVLWAIHKAGERARLELYFDWALESARAGQLETAREVALETVGHVSLEDPRPHALLGELAVTLGDRGLLREARAFLRFLNCVTWERAVAAAAAAGQARFDGYEESLPQ